MDRIRIDMVKSRYEVRQDSYDDQVWHDVKMLLDEINERDILISDFKEQIVNLKSQ